MTLDFKASAETKVGEAVDEGAHDLATGVVVVDHGELATTEVVPVKKA